MSHAPWEAPRDAREQGSNVELPRADEIDAELQLRAAQLDDALGELRDALKIHEEAKVEHELAFAVEHLKTNPEETVAIREAHAKIATRLSRRELATASALVKSAQAALDVRQSQLTAAQTRAKLYMTQANIR
jgi:hypothetical protein